MRLFEYQAAILHAKTLVADDHASLVGSTDLDLRSFHFNADVNLVILDDAVGGVFAESFEEDLASPTEATPSLWRRRTVLHEIGDTLARGLAPMLERYPGFSLERLAIDPASVPQPFGELRRSTARDRMGLRMIRRAGALLSPARSTSRRLRIRRENRRKQR